MKKVMTSMIVLGVLSSLADCASEARVPPIDVGDRLVLPADHPYMIPPQGIRFSNGFMIGVPQ